MLCLFFAVLVALSLSSCERICASATAIALEVTLSPSSEGKVGFSALRENEKDAPREVSFPFSSSGSEAEKGLSLPVFALDMGRDLPSFTAEMIEGLAQWWGKVSFFS